MPQEFQHHPFSHESSPEAGSWLPPGATDDELALGFECAHPSLQIERWLLDDAAQESSALN